METAPNAQQGALPQASYRRSGRSGLKLPTISLGLWHNFGDDRPIETMRQILTRAFELGITHFDLANNYGPPPGSAERNFGEILRTDFAGLRNQLVISTKAGYDMWPGPYGEWGSRKYLLSSLGESLDRMGLDWVDIFYSHRYDPDTPLEETMGALTSAVQLGLSMYVGVSSYSEQTTREAARILRQNGTPMLIHQPSYSLLNRWIERGLLDALEDEGAGCIVFSPLAQGLLTSRYLGVDPANLAATLPPDSRAAAEGSFKSRHLSRGNLEHVHALNDIAKERGQTLAQMALAWCLRDPRVTSVLIGASSVQQLEENWAALSNLDFTEEELARIDEHAVEAGINIWRRSSAAGGEEHPEPVGQS
ncbi:MAG: L-glyceraldehyde 3-phosphate reductase [Trueperaceae bacterium]